MSGWFSAQNMFDTLFPIVYTFTGIFGLVMNLLLAYTVIWHTPKVIKTYSMLILNFAVTDALACFCETFAQPRIIPAGMAFGHVYHGVCSHFGSFVFYVSYSLLLHCFSHFQWSLLLSFTYRFYILHREPPAIKNLLIVLACIYTPSAIQAVLFLFAYDDPELVRAELLRQFPQYEELHSATISGTVDATQLPAFLSVAHITLPITPIYVAILLLRYSILHKLTSKGTCVTKTTKNMHSQLLMALSYQAVIPAFYLFPVIFYCLAQFDIYHNEIVESLIFYTVLFIPVLSPISSFMLISPYRRFLLVRVLRVRKSKPGDNYSSTEKNQLSNVFFTSTKISSSN